MARSKGPGEYARQRRKQERRDLQTIEGIYGAAPEAVQCGECPATCRNVGGLAIYPHRPDLNHKRFWLCDACGAYVGCHLTSTIPLGIPAGPETQKARRAAHAAFDPLWQRKIERDGVSKKEARSAAYKWLAEQLGTEPAKTHIGMFDAPTARRVAEVCAPFLAEKADA